MKNIILRHPTITDMWAFLAAVNHSKTLHFPWVKPPQTEVEFLCFLEKCQQSSNFSYLIIESLQIVGVINLNNIIRSCFQNAYLGFYAMHPFQGKGYMSYGLKHVIQQAFNNLSLHRLEANIQPNNYASIQLVKASGFRKEGYSPHYLEVNNTWQDHERWAITFEDFNKH
ncbi:MAG: hypothetical protein A3E87_10755 [Gammaproteobacteria bacterium RIFCSPHIGHO2_12_FULL_35_23]|nr:MAG: hypothetical protein A3E87_10755 [Gammaproteobacteria bacterium RIFCSPHIGHO2_12_FULL_35_23]